MERSFWIDAAEYHDKSAEGGVCLALMRVGAPRGAKQTFETLFVPDGYAEDRTAWFEAGYFWPKRGFHRQWRREHKEQRVLALLFMHWMDQDRNDYYLAA